MTDTDQLLISQFFKEHQALAIKYIEGLELPAIVELAEVLSLDQSRLLLTQINAFKSAKVLEKLKAERAATLLSTLEPLSIQALLRSVNKANRDSILNEFSPDQATYLRKSLDYRKDRVGAHIQTDVLTLSSKMTVEVGLKTINEGGSTIQPHIFVLNDKKKLMGYIELNDLVQGENHLQLKSLHKPIRRPALADMGIDDLLDRWDHGLVNLPVVDVEGIFLGSVSKVTLSKIREGSVNHKQIDNAAIQAGNALGDLYLIGLTSLLGSPSESDNNI